MRIAHGITSYSKAEPGPHPRVQRGQRVVQQHDVGVGVGGAREGDALLLPAADIYSAISQLRLVARCAANPGLASQPRGQATQNPLQGSQAQCANSFTSKGGVVRFTFKDTNFESAQCTATTTSAFTYSFAPVSSSRSGPSEAPWMARW